MGHYRESILRSLLLSTFMNDLDNRLECILGKFPYNMKLGGVAGTPEGPAPGKK